MRVAGDYKDVVDEFFTSNRSLDDSLVYSVFLSNLQDVLWLGHSRERWPGIV